MKKYLVSLLTALIFAVSVGTNPVSAQVLGNSAKDFGNYSLNSKASTAAGAVTMTVRGFAAVTTPDGRTFIPITTSTPLRIENGGANAETVTPSSVSCPVNHAVDGCTFVATFSNSHVAGVSIQSASFGLCEAINNTIGTGIVVVANGFGGTAATITSSTLGGACDSTSVDVVDFRTGGLLTYSSVGGVYTGGLGASNGATVSAVDRGGNNVHTTVITLAATPLAVVNGTEYQGVKIFDFPEGRIYILGATASIAETTTSAIAGTINQTANFDWSVGTATASNVTLATTMLDIIPKVDGASSATINVAAAASTGALAVGAQFDGTTTAIDAYINTAFPTTSDVDADGTLTLSGTVTITWIQLGDL